VIVVAGVWLNQEGVLGKSVQGKSNGKQSSTDKTGKARSNSKHKEKALYGKIYEETKHDVNRAIEDAILEASKKATDMVLQPKVTSKLVDNMASKIQAEVAGSGEGEGGTAIDEMAQSYTAAVADKLTGASSTSAANAEHKKTEHKKASKKHQPGKVAKHTEKPKTKKESPKSTESTAKATEDSGKAAEEASKAAEEIAKATEDDPKSETEIESITVSGVDDEEAEAAATSDKTPSDEAPVEAKAKPDAAEEAEEKSGSSSKAKEEKSAATEKKESSELLADKGLEASGMDMDMDDIDTTKSSANKDETPEGDGDDDMEEKSDLVPTDTSEKEPEARDSGPAAASGPPKPVESDVASVAMAAKQIAQEGGQEDLKALLDESINNLVRANSAVEVLLKATNPNTAAAAIKAQQMQPMAMQPQQQQQQQQQQSMLQQQQHQVG